MQVLFLSIISNADEETRGDRVKPGSLIAESVLWACIDAVFRGSECTELMRNTFCL